MHYAKEPDSECTFSRIPTRFHKPGSSFGTRVEFAERPASDNEPAGRVSLPTETGIVGGANPASVILADTPEIERGLCDSLCTQLPTAS